MEPAGLAVGVLGLASLFEVCLKLYNGVSNVKSYPNDCKNFALLFEFEQARFRLIEEFVIPLDNTRAIQHTSSQLSTHHGEQNQDLSASWTRNALEQVQILLEEAVRQMEKHQAQPSNPTTKRLSWTKSFSKRLRPIKWVTIDKDALEQILNNLKRMNDCLWESLAQQSLDRLRLNFSATQILPANPANLHLMQNAAEQAGYGTLRKGLSVRLASLGQELESPAQSSALPPSPLHDFRLPRSDLTIQGPYGTSKYMTGCLSSSSTQVLIERRAAFQTTTVRAAAVGRLNGLVKVLQSMISQPWEVYDTKGAGSSVMDFGILRCLGWIMPDHEDFTEIDLVFSYPPNTSGSPNSLNAYLRQRHKPSHTEVSSVWNQPPLGSRFKLALKIARLYANFISVGYLHRAINSHNVLFFMDNIHQPYLAGVAEARPEKISEHSSNLSKGDMGRELYWPWEYVVKQADPNSTSEPWNTATDLYGLGVVLVEIGHWCTASQIRGHRSIRDFHKDLLPASVGKLEFHMGEIYKDAVLTCLNAERATSIDMYQQFSSKILRQLELCCA